MHAQPVYYLIFYGAAASGNRKNSGSSFHSSQTRVCFCIFSFIFKKYNIFIPHFHAAISKDLITFKCIFMLLLVTKRNTFRDRLRERRSNRGPTVEGSRNVLGVYHISAKCPFHFLKYMSII